MPYSYLLIYHNKLPFNKNRENVCREIFSEQHPTLIGKVLPAKNVTEILKFAPTLLTGVGCKPDHAFVVKLNIDIEETKSLLNTHALSLKPLKELFADFLVSAVPLKLLADSSRSKDLAEQQLSKIFFGNETPLLESIFLLNEFFSEKEPALKVQTAKGNPSEPAKTSQSTTP